MKSDQIALIVVALCVFCPQSICTKSPLSPQKKLPLVTIVTTGGTIAEKKDPITGGSVPVVSGHDLIQTIPDIERIARINIVEFSNIDSSRMSPAQWHGLSKKVDAILSDPEVQGVVVTHGTDTMEPGAYFLDLTLQSRKPVVFVGSMRNGSAISPDGPENIYNAIVQITSPATQHFGVTVTLNQYINAARDVRKVETTNVQTFDSGHKGYLGYICMDKVHKFHDLPPIRKLPLPAILPNVVLLKTFAGDDGSFIRHAITDGAQGIVVEAVGAGNVNEEVFGAIKEALNKNIPVVITTRVFSGAVYPMYGGDGGGLELQRSGAILAGDLNGTKARILLMIALGNGLSRDEIISYFDIC